MIRLVEAPDYSGDAGVAMLRQQREAMLDALKSRDWLELQRLDRSCSVVVAKVLAATDRDYTGLQAELSALKAIYWQALAECRTQETSAFSDRDQTQH